MNLVLVSLAYWANGEYQAFCNPVPWAKWVLAISIAPVLFQPVVQWKGIWSKRIVFFLHGVAFCCCVYCIFFIGLMHFVAFLAVFFLMPFGLLAYLPLFLFAQILFHIRHAEDRISRRSFRSALVSCLVVSLGAAFWFNHEFHAINDAWKGQSEPTEIPENYMTERMLGMHFKYHLSYTIYDGWRPPLHDPALVVAVWLNAPFISELDISGLMPAPPYRTTYDLNRRVAVYRSVFPDVPVRQACSCAKEYRGTYYNDPILD